MKAKEKKPASAARDRENQGQLGASHQRCTE
jgi:hypothetical protein